MIGLLCFVLAIMASPFKSNIRLEAENAVLRHQLIVLRRKLRRRVQFANSDRWFLSSYIAGFLLSFRFLQSSVPRRSSTGTGLAFAAIGAGSHDLWEAGRRSRRGCAR